MNLTGEAVAVYQNLTGQRRLTFLKKAPTNPNTGSNWLCVITGRGLSELEWPLILALRRHSIEAILAGIIGTYLLVAILFLHTTTAISKHHETLRALSAFMRPEVSAELGLTPLGSSGEHVIPSAQVFGISLCRFSNTEDGMPDLLTRFHRMARHLRDAGWIIISPGPPLVAACTPVMHKSNGSHGIAASAGEPQIHIQQIFDKHLSKCVSPPPLAIEVAEGDLILEWKAREPDLHYYAIQWQGSSIAKLYSKLSTSCSGTDREPSVLQNGIACRQEMSNGPGFNSSTTAKNEHQATGQEFSRILGITSRQAESLRREGITIETLEHVSDEHLLKIDGIGPQTVSRIRQHFTT